jgi:DNA-binding FrmR family transcriptional regulator
MERIKKTMGMLGTTNLSKAVRFLIEAAGSIRTMSKDDIESIAATVEAPARKKKESYVHMGASITEKDMDLIDTTMQKLNTENVSEAFRFIIEVSWTLHGSKISRHATIHRKRPAEKRQLPFYFRTNFTKAIERANKKVIDEVVEQILKEDREAGYSDRVVVLTMDKIEKYTPVQQIGEVVHDIKEVKEDVKEVKQDVKVVKEDVKEVVKEVVKEEVTKEVRKEAKEQIRKEEAEARHVTDRLLEPEPEKKIDDKRVRYLKDRK